MKRGRATWQERKAELWKDKDEENPDDVLLNSLRKKQQTATSQDLAEFHRYCFRPYQMHICACDPCVDRLQMVMQCAEVAQLPKQSFNFGARHEPHQFLRPCQCLST